MIFSKCVLIYAAFMLLITSSSFAFHTRAEGEMGAKQQGNAENALSCEAVLWYFWRDHCHFCSLSEAWLDELAVRHPQLCIRKVEVVRDVAGRELFMTMMKDRGRQATSVPAFILEDTVWVGYSQVLLEDIEASVKAGLSSTVSERLSARGRLDLGPLGVFDMSDQPMVAATILIAFVDGFNPCSLWVLSVLLAMILGVRSRSRIAAVGLTFLVVTAAIYGLFIVGLFTAFTYASHLGWIQVVVGLLALFFGIVNVKDFFAFKRGISFSIPDRFKPRIYKGGRAIREDRPLWLTLVITVLLAGGVALIELPCTAGFPVVWTTLATEAGLGATAFFGLLVIYLLVYLCVELAIVAGAVITMRTSRMQEKHGRNLKLVGGMVMIALAVVILVDPTIMEHLPGSLLVISVALGASIVVLLVHKRLTEK